MDLKKQQLLKKAYDEYINLMLYDFPLDKISEIVANDVTGYGTTLDEKVLEIKRLGKIVADQREQGAGLDMQFSIMPVHRRISPDEDTAIFMDESEISMVVDGNKNVIPVRLSSVFEFSNNAWKLVHLHGSKAVETEEDTWHLNEWKQKSEQLQILVDEKTAELTKQNRELEIEAAMERVRAKTMAMQRSEELAEVAVLLFEQINNLGINSFSSGFNIWDDEHKNLVSWMSNATGNLNPPFEMPMHTYSQHKRIYAAWKNHESFMEDDITGEALTKHYKFLRSFPLLDESFNIAEKAGIKIPDRQVHNIAIFSHGYLLFNTLEPCPDAHGIFKRFAKVFEQTYTRFLDLQKAEAQAREAKVEAALERVRSKSMAMHKSGELRDVVNTLYGEFQSLKVNFHVVAIQLILDNSKDLHIWLSTSDGMYNDIIHWPYTDLRAFHEMHKSWSTRKMMELTLSKTETRKFFKEYFKLEAVPKERKVATQSVEVIDIIGSYQELTGIFLMRYTEGTYSPYEKDILRRFAKVFEQTYTRFLDLQKAEEQAREAEIELALERVRARTMAMQHSDELAEASFLLDSQVRALGIKTRGCAFNIYGENESTEWFSSALGTMPVYKTPRENIFLQYYEEGQKGKSMYIDSYVGDACAVHYDYLCTLPVMGEALKQIKESGGSFPDQQIDHVTYFKYGYLLFITLEPVPDAHDIFLRFAKVFEQTYTRFLDLQKAEAQAREAQIEAALERVRSRTMAMHKSEELSEVVKLLYSQIEPFGVSTFGISIAIFREEENAIEYWFADHLDSNLLQSYKMVGQKNKVFRQNWEDWRSKTPQTHVYMEGQEKRDFDTWILEESDFRKLPEELKRDIRTHKTVCFTFTFFKYGYFESVDLTIPDEENTNVLIRFAKVFEQTYTRFLDLQKAEAQAKEAQIEAALERVRSRTMAMHNSEELGEVAILLYKEFNSLIVGDFFNCGFVIVNEAEGIQNGWMTQPEGTFNEELNLPYPGDVVLEKRAKAWKERTPVFWDKISGEKLEIHLKYVRDHSKSANQINTILPYMPDPCYFYCGNFAQGYLHILAKEQLRPEDEVVLSRFTKVFEQTYTRFLDLQKAEAQAREAQIESALEKVRSSSLAMHKTDELQEVVTVLVEKLQELGVIVDAGGVIICTYFKDSKDVMHWIASPDFSYSGSYLLPWFGHVIFNEAWESRLSGIDYFSKSYAVEDKNSFFEYAFEHSDYKNFPYEFKNWVFESKKHSLSFAWAKNSAILIPSFTEIEPSESAKQILIRFAKVFEQAYVRFMDMQKAEAQAREAQIEAALERVRSRTMGMQRSEELQDAAILMFDQVELLGVQIMGCGFNIWDEDRKEATAWMSGMDRIQPPFKTSSSEDIFRRIYEAAERGESLFVEEQAGDELIAHYRYMASIPIFRKILDGLESRGFSAPSFQIMHCSFFAQGYLMFITHEPAESANDIFKRFAKVFEQTYTRFLDLQKAEEQAREAKIEAALERVRSRTMGMQKSSELQEVINRIFIEMTGLGVKMDSSYIITHLEEDINKGFAAWVSIRELSYATELFQAYLDHPVVHRFYKAWKEKEPHFAATFSKAEKNRYFRHQFKFSPQLKLIPDQRKKTILDGNGWSLSWVIMKNAAIILQRYQNNPFSEKEITIQKRFARVFEQTYTRFLDLKKAEAQAREAIKQASLDRVRGEIASMRTKDDLNRITPLIWKELNTLGVPFIRCGVFIMNVNKRVIQTYLSTPDGNSLTAFEMSFDEEEIASGAVKNWRKNNIYQDFWNKEQFVSFMQNLIKTGQVKNVESFQGSAAPPESLYLNFVPFKQGMLYVGNISELKEEVLQLVQSLADSFSIAYARYEDFRQLEEAKNQIEKTFTELKAAQSQLIQAEKMASLGELTAGIAHEIQNPLNFVNNFSEISSELIDEMHEELDKGDIEEAKAISTDIKQNLEKINLHGKRADAIVKGMLQHSQTSTGKKELTDINKLADEYLRLSYHGLRAKDKSFNADFKTDFDESLPKINVIPQDIGRVLLNLINNAFYAAPLPPEGGFRDPNYIHKPTVTVSTTSSKSPLGDLGVEIRVIDNGPGIPKKILDKIFQPFFTTKPTGQGTGLGLSLCYDVVKAHGGVLKLETKEGEGSEFTVQLPA